MAKLPRSVKTPLVLAVESLGLSDPPTLEERMAAMEAGHPTIQAIVSDEQESLLDEPAADRVVDALTNLGSEHEPAPGWEGRVESTICDGEQTPGPAEIVFEEIRDAEPDCRDEDGPEVAALLEAV